jgi:predicted anti-sigma-YlaC factor YlaD
VVSRFFKRGNDRDGHSDRARAICDELRANASDLIDGECDEELVLKLEAHLTECTDCEGWTESLRSTIELLQNVPKQDAPDEIMAKIKAATTESK